jgi:hypothetical protein
MLGGSSVGGSHRVTTTLEKTCRIPAGFLYV